MKLSDYRGILIITILLWKNCIVSSRPSAIDPTFSCKNNSQKIGLTKHNDGIADCNDGSDEYEDPLLLYTVTHPNELSDPVMRGFFFKKNNNTSFRTQLITSCNYPLTLLTAHGPYVYAICPEQKNVILQFTRNGSNVESIQRPGNVLALAFDEITSNVYVLEKGHIKMCDKNFIFCSILRGKLRHNPTSLAFSSKDGFLFWVEEKGRTESYIVKSRRDGTLPEIKFKQNKSDPIKFITVDQYSSRLYWYQNETKKIYLSSINGSDTRRVGTYFLASNVGLYSLAAYNDTLFWANQLNQVVIVVHDESDYYSSSLYRSDLSKTNIGKNLIIHDSSLFANQNEHACNQFTCSHLCTYVSPNEPVCLCDTSDKTILLNENSGFCEGSTVLVTTGNDLYVIGLKNNPTGQISSVIHKANIETLESISAISYDSVGGRVILAETGKQNIYTWTPRRKQLDLIVQGEVGTINSMEYDDFGNNLYWIDPVNKTINVFSFATSETMVLFGENSESVPFDFTLNPSKGYMFILCKNKTMISLERITMDGNTYTQQLLYNFSYKNTSYLSLHYMRSEETLLLVDHFNDEIKYTYEDTKTSKDHINFEFLVDSTLKHLNSVTSLNEFVIWTEDDLSLQLIDMHSHEHSIQTIPLNLQVINKGSELKILGVISSKKSSKSECRSNNGGCQHLCLITSETTSTCRWTGNSGSEFHSHVYSEIVTDSPISFTEITTDEGSNEINQLETRINSIANEIDILKNTSSDSFYKYETKLKFIEQKIEKLQKNFEDNAEEPINLFKKRISVLEDKIELCQCMEKNLKHVNTEESLNEGYIYAAESKNPAQKDSSNFFWYSFIGVTITAMTAIIILFYYKLFRKDKQMGSGFSDVGMLPVNMSQLTLVDEE